MQPAASIGTRPKQCHPTSFLRTSLSPMSFPSSNIQNQSNLRADASEMSNSYHPQWSKLNHVNFNQNYYKSTEIQCDQKPAIIPKVPSLNGTSHRTAMALGSPATNQHHRNPVESLTHARGNFGARNEPTQLGSSKRVSTWHYNTRRLVKGISSKGVFSRCSARAHSARTGEPNSETNRLHSPVFPSTQIDPSCGMASLATAAMTLMWPHKTNKGIQGSTNISVLQHPSSLNSDSKIHHDGFYHTDCDQHGINATSNNENGRCSGWCAKETITGFISAVHYSISNALDSKSISRNLKCGRDKHSATWWN